MKGSLSIGLLFLFSLLLLTQGPIPFPEAIYGMLQRIWGETEAWNPILDERLPRLIVILCSGASLAASGLVMQSLFHNPLASPSVLGISLGGSLAIFLTFLFGWHHGGMFTLALMAFFGSLCTLFLVWILSWKRGFEQGHYLLLTGLAISTFLVAIQGSLVYIFREEWSLIQAWMEWEAGSTMDRNWDHVHVQLPLTLVGLLGFFTYRSELNLLSLGDEEALNLGVDVTQVRFHLFVCVALLTAGSLASMGIIPFFGLVLPHILRQIWGADHYQLLPKCLLVGSTSMVGMDWLLRYLNFTMLSIGQVSAFLGGLFFLFLVLNPRKVGAY